ncbi:MAG: hypothetical protein LBO79_07070 [Zoogloeaceae bacterium]|nr:hypothetical protein [Zoogloeaceae bacterium]
MAVSQKKKCAIDEGRGLSTPGARNDLRMSVDGGNCCELPGVGKDFLPIAQSRELVGEPVADEFHLSGLELFTGNNTWRKRPEESIRRKEIVLQYPVDFDKHCLLSRFCFLSPALAFLTRESFLFRQSPLL